MQLSFKYVGVYPRKPFFIRQKDFTSTGKKAILIQKPTTANIKLVYVNESMERVKARQTLLFILGVDSLSHTRMRVHTAVGYVYQTTV